jgi:putative endonuclease
VEAEIVDRRPGAGTHIAAIPGMDRRGELGRLGEDLACQELERRGYVILSRRFRTRCGEIDIVARDGRVLVFVEVKTRSDGRFGSPFESLTWHKRHRLTRMALSYMFLRRVSNTPCRFDVVGVETDQSGATHVELVRQAFVPEPG